MWRGRYSAWEDRGLPPTGFKPEKKALFSITLALSCSFVSLFLLCSYVREPGFNSISGLLGVVLLTPLLTIATLYALVVALRTYYVEGGQRSGVVRAAVVVTIPAVVLSVVSTIVCHMKVLTPNEERAYAALLNYHRRLTDYRSKNGTYPEELWQIFYPIRPDPLREEALERYYSYHLDYVFYREEAGEPIERYFVVAMPCWFIGGVRILMVNEKGEVRASEPGLRSRPVYDYEEAERLWSVLRPYRGAKK